MGKGIVEKLQQEFAKDLIIDDEWLPYEIHPDTPAGGVRLDEYFPGMNTALFFEEINQRAKRYELFFGPQEVMSNSRLALMGGEFAKEHGRYHQYHEAVFKAFFTECQNIGDMAVLLDAARESGLDESAFKEALGQGVYLAKLEETTQLARDKWVNAAPTFIIEGHGNVTGASSMDSFREIFAKLSNKH
ncbi:DsbA family oxidoreductase [Maridesulfovibrio salexigens]|uniref:DsbA family oxidoreductase n=1 Tax=Maridesulfovibrio salexigens TaxID=880 RepID=UPI0009D63E90|nr:DsbA family protein [Maridesulfovibrio salexigens]